LSRRLTCNPARPDDSVIGDVVRGLEDDLMVVMPTETQYALLMRADREDAPEKIGRIKKRSGVVPAAVFVKDIQMAELFCEMSYMARRLAARFLPGPMTLVLSARAGQRAVAAGFASQDGFGIRISSSPVVKAVMAKTSFPVTATSANISGETSLATVQEIAEVFGEDVDLYVDGGPCRGVVPSTVLKVTDTVSVLRHGAIPEAEIRRFLKESR